MENIKITVKNNKEIKTINARRGDGLLAVLSSNGYYISAPCGGMGRCGKCKIKLIKGKVKGAEADGGGFISVCRAVVYEDITVEINEAEGSGLVLFNGGEVETDGIKGYGIALDIGTTTLAFYLMDLYSGREIDSYSCLNPQGVYGGDVISRISACKDSLLQLNRLIIEKTNAVISAFRDKHGVDVDRITVCGNTVMLHLFANEDASSLGIYPFKPVFTETRIYEGRQLGVNAGIVTLLPSVSAFVGGDITAGILSSGMTLTDENNMLIDIGTNGEAALYTGGRLFCAGTAAGPAFEGAGIECGMGGVEGAVNSAVLNNGRIEFTVINNAVPKGICGSGLIDIMAVMLEAGAINDTGAFTEGGAFSEYINGGRLYLSGDIYVSQKDVREFQLAKSAICAGIKTLIYKAGLIPENIDNFFIAGGMGYYINPYNAVKTGLLPRQARNRITVIGNSAGAGAKMCLLSEKQKVLCEKIAKSCKNIELAEEPFFAKEYIKNMSFEKD